jgi:hypothetical protein
MYSRVGLGSRSIDEQRAAPVLAPDRDWIAAVRLFAFAR